MKRFATRTMLVLLGACAFVWIAPAMAGARIIYSDDGISELRAPAHWSVRPDIGRNAALRVSNTAADYHLTVYSYLPEEYEPKTLEQFAKDFTANLMESLSDGRMSAPGKLTINGRPAVQYEVSGRSGENRFVFVSTTVEGKRAKHQLVATVSETDYPVHRGELHKAMLSFRESAEPRLPKVRIDMVFNWPERAKSEFTVHNKKTGRHGTQEMWMSGTTTVRPQEGEGLLVSSRVADYKLTLSDKDESKQNYLQNLMQQATSEIPDYVISTEGEFIRVDNHSAYYARIEQALLKGLPGKSGEAKETAKKLVKSLLSEEILMVSMQDEWNKQVENWAGSSYAVGEVYTYEMQYQMPALGDTVFPMRVSQKLVGYVPCHAQDEARSCLQMDQTSLVSGPALDQAMQQYLNRIFGEMAGDKVPAPVITVDGVEIIKTVTLVTDPETLMPYEVKESENKTTRIRVNGEKQTGKETSETTTRYAY